MHKVLPLILFLLVACQGADAPEAPGTAPRTAASSSPPPGGEEGAAIRDCFWTITVDEAVVNTLYPDIYAIYWVAAMPLLPGTEVWLDGQYPHARYMSFNLYDPALRPVDVLADQDIQALAGSMNPFVAGADRLAEARDYSIRVVSGTPPDDPAAREPNTLYSQLPLGDAAAAPVPYAILIYRIYVPDTERDRAGDMPLPRFRLSTPAGELQGQEACDALEPFLPAGLNEQVTQAPVDLPVPTGFGAFADLSWLKFFGLQSSTENRFNATPARDPLHALVPNPGNNSGGFASNADNQYIYAALNQNLGPLAVFEAKMPKTPTTVAGDAIMGDGDMRYWSVCSYEIASQRYYDCYYDENAVLDADNRGVFLVGREDERPANATPECGVNWLPWGPVQNSLLIMRHMLAEPDFPHAIQQIPSPPGACEAPVMGEYFPYGQHLDRAAFEALGCPVNPNSIANRATQFDASPDCPQTPTGEVESLGQP